jgi:hypothetical protein
LFESGIGRDGLPVKAKVEGSAIPLPGGLLSCAGCHGRDGKGRSVSGLRAPDITWQSLTKPYVWRVGAGRRRPPYDPALFARAVSTGVDSGGRVLASAMPRFQLTPDDTADVLAYLRELGTKPDPGVGADTLAIGVLLPESGEAIIRSALEQYREQLNRAGGIFGRQIEFSFMSSIPAPDEQRSAARMLTAQETVLALLSIDDAAGREIAQAADRHGLPLIALRPTENAPPARNVFYLSAGLAGELSALVTYAARQVDPSRARLVLVYQNEGDDAAIATLRRRIEHARWEAVDEVKLPVAAKPDALPPETLRRLTCSDAVLMMTAAFSDAQNFRCPDSGHRSTLLLLPGSRTAPEWVPKGLATETQAVVAFDPTVFALDRRTGHDAVPLTPAEAQESAVAAAQLLVEGARRAGHELTRAKLIDAIESIQRFEANHLPPLTFGPRQHIGFTGAEIVPFDFRNGQLTGPVELLQVD